MIQFLFKFIFILIIIFLIYHLLTKKYLSPYKLFLVLGKKGSGKSTLISKLAIKYLNRGYPVYTNCADCKINGVRIINTYDIGKYQLENCVVLIDEISVFYDNRRYKETSKEFIEWLRYMRHDRLIVWAFSQSYDCDKKIRTMADGIYILKKYFRVFSIARLVDKNINIKESAMDAESQIVDELKFVPFFLPGATRFTYIPKYVQYFDSFKKLHELLPMPFKSVLDGIYVNTVDVSAIDENGAEINLLGSKTWITRKIRNMRKNKTL